MDQTVRAVAEAGSSLFRAARAALGLDLVEVSRRAGLSAAAVLAAEGRGAASVVAPRTDLDSLRRVYEEAGVRFIDDGPAGRGIQIGPGCLRPGTSTPWNPQWAT